MDDYTIRLFIIQTLLNDSTLHPTLFPGGVWPRLPRQGTGWSATPGAWYGSENPAEAGKLKPTISVIDGGNVPSPGGVALNGFEAFPLVYGYVVANPSGEAALATLESRLRTHFPLSGRSYPLGTGNVQMKTLEKQQQRDGDDFGFASRIFAVWRIQGVYVQ